MNPSTNLHILKHEKRTYEVRCHNQSLLILTSFIGNFFCTYVTKNTTISTL